MTRFDIYIDNALEMLFIKSVNMLFVHATENHQLIVPHLKNIKDEEMHFCGI